MSTSSEIVSGHRAQQEMNIDYFWWIFKT